jgi:hypothetical protein
MVSCGLLSGLLVATGAGDPHDSVPARTRERLLSDCSLGRREEPPSRGHRACLPVPSSLLSESVPTL